MMNAEKLIEQMSLDLLLSGKLSREKLMPFIHELRESNLHPAARELVEQFASQVDDPAQSLSPAKAYDLTLFFLERLSAELATDGKGKPSEVKEALNDGVLNYDGTHGEEILNSFLSEVSEHLQTIEEQLMRLESRPGEKDALNAVFGAMHSLKGITGFLNVKAAHELAHEAETVMEVVRKREAGIDPEECDAILKVVDVLRAIRDRILAHSHAPHQTFPSVPEECPATLAELRRLSHREAQAAAPVPASGTKILDSKSDDFSNAHAVDSSGLVRVKVQKLDSLIEAIGELVVTQTQINQDAALRLVTGVRLSQNLSQLGKITRELQAVAMSLRMYPLRELFSRVTRLARDLARKQGKKVEVFVDGEETELDKNVIEGLVDPLTHLVRNAVDHGVDTPEARIAAGKTACAKLTISARHQGGSVLVTVSDDGRGLDLERIAARGRERGLLGFDETPARSRLLTCIFEPGFSTADQVTEISGRGVGLDVVRRNVQALGGRVAVDSVAGQSTEFTLTLPLTLAIIDGLIVRTGTERYIVPITSVVESLQPKCGQVSTVHARGEVITVRDAHLPLVRLSRFAGVTPEYNDPCNAIVMIVEGAGERYGLVVDELLGQHQVVIRNLGERLSGVRGVASGAILGDGRVGLILDLEHVLQDSRERQAAS